jgi:hypothetical protein
VAEPTIEIDTRAYNASTGTFDVAIIDGGVVQSGTLRWSTSGVDGNVELPSSGDKWAEEFWWDSGADTQICDSTDTPSAASQPEAMFKVFTDAESFDTAPRFSVYDDSSHDIPVEEVCVGTTGHGSPFIKGSIGTGYDPAAQWTTEQYWDESPESVLHDLETNSSQNGNGNNGLGYGSAQSYLESSSTDLNTNPQYIWLALSIPDDATTGVDTIDCVFSMTYTYT